MTTWIGCGTEVKEFITEKGLDIGGSWSGSSLTRSNYFHRDIKRILVSLRMTSPLQNLNDRANLVYLTLSENFSSYLSPPISEYEQK